MPSFLPSLRRKSRASILTNATHKADGSEDQPNASPDGSSRPAANGHGIVRNKSSSTLASVGLGSSTPPSTVPSDDISQANPPRDGAPPVPGSRPPTRPALNTSTSKRYSMNGLPPNTANGSHKSLNPSSLLAPRVVSISDGSWVNQKVLIIFGHIGDLDKSLDGMLVVNHHLDGFPPTSWPVNDSHFKALVHLQPGFNRLRLDFNSPKVSASSTSIPAHSSWLHINYLPLNNAPPLQLAVILGSDSPGTFDAMPDRMQREGNSLELATRKFKMAAYLWQAFTGEQMQRHGFGRRIFRFEEEWQPGTLSYQDWATGTMRNEARVHIIRCNKTVADIRDLDRAQQYERAQQKSGLFDIGIEAVKGYFRNKPGQTQYVACLFIDSHWDFAAKTIRGHAAIGGGDGQAQIAVFGSHALHSYPSSLEEVWQAFSDCTRTNTAFVANDLNESGSNWEAANIGIGAHLHEVGHLFGCPHQESGVMLRDYVTLNRTFTSREPYSTRTKSPGQRLVLQGDECAWHRLDALRFRFHSCFKIPIDPPASGDGSVQVWNVDSKQGGVIATAASGIAWIELYTDGDDVCHYFREFPEASNGNGVPFPRQVALGPLVDSELRDLLPKEKRTSCMRLELFSAGGGKHVIQDWSQLANQKIARVRIPDGRYGFRGSKLGFSQMQGSTPQDLILDSAYIQTKLLVCIRVYHGFAVDGVEFVYEDTTTQLFGKRGGKVGGSEFALDIRRGELLMGFALRAGLWIDGLQILTSLGRKSEMFGNATGGSGHTLIPPRGYTIGGISGSCADWVDGFSLIIIR